MTAVEAEETVELLPTWFHPGPEGGWTVEDLDNLPPWAPKRIELLDGALIVMSPQRMFHSTVMRRLANALEPQLPDGHIVDMEMVVRLSKRNGPEPDVLVAAAPVSASRTYYDVGDVLLVVEIVSEESVLRDRDVKPRRYAEAGIPHFWRIEEDEEHSGEPIVHAFRLDPPSGEYVPAAAREKVRLRTKIPFLVDIDVTALFP